MPRFSVARPSKIYPNWDFWFENKPSGNPVRNSKYKKRKNVATKNVRQKITKKMFDKMQKRFYRKMSTKMGLYLCRYMSILAVWLIKKLWTEAESFNA
jgi:hypothetical protein